MVSFEVVCPGEILQADAAAKSLVYLLHYGELLERGKLVESGAEESKM